MEAELRHRQGRDENPSRAALCAQSSAGEWAGSGPSLGLQLCQCSGSESTSGLVALALGQQHLPRVERLAAAGEPVLWRTGCRSLVYSGRGPWAQARPPGQGAALQARGGGGDPALGEVVLTAAGVLAAPRGGAGNWGPPLGHPVAVSCGEEPTLSGSWQGPPPSWGREPSGEGGGEGCQHSQEAGGQQQPLASRLVGEDVLQEVVDVAHRNPCGRGANAEATLHSPEAPKAWGSDALHGQPAQRGARLGPE